MCALLIRRCLAASIACALADPAAAQALRIAWGLHSAEAEIQPPPERERPALVTTLRLDLALQGESAAPPARLQSLIAVVKVNEQEKGQFVVYLRGDDDFLVAHRDLQAWAHLASIPRGITIDGDEYVPLVALPGVRYHFDDVRLELHIAFPAGAFPTQVFTYQASARAALTPSDEPSALLNYRAGFSGATAQAGAWNVSTEQDVHWRHWLLRNQLFANHAPETPSFLRGLTSLVRDDPARLTRFTIGDATAPLTDLTGGEVVGGLTYSKAYELDPYFIRQPTAAFRTAVDVPSQVDVYVGGNRILRQDVGPGPVEIGNLSYLLGRRDLDIVVRDAFGRTRSLDLPFYFADRGLAPGLHDFSYSVGVLREAVATTSDDYGPAAFSAFHRYGVNDALTLGGQAEGTREFANAGPSLVLRSDRLGVASLTALASEGRGTARAGRAGAFGYSFLSGGFSFFASSRRASVDFLALQARDFAGLPRRDDNVSISYTHEKLGTVSAFARRTTSHADEDSRSYGFGYSLPFGRRFNFQATYRHNTGVGAGYEIFAGLQYLPSATTTALASVRDDSGTRTASMQVGSLLPEGEGFAYQLSADSSIGGNGPAFRQFSPEAIYQGRYATLQADATTSSTGGTRATTYTGSISGALAYVGGTVGLSRPIDDGFALVRIEPPIPDVRVYLNRQEMGRTGKDGELFLPRVVSYVENHMSIDDRDVPIENAIEEKGRTLVPPSGSGALVVFHAPLTRAIMGTLVRPAADGGEPIELALFTFEAGGRSVEVPTGRGGEFYFENVPAGRYTAQLRAEGRSCAFPLTIPDSHESFLRLGKVAACLPR